MVVRAFCLYGPYMFKAYACPDCGKAMRPHDGPWAIVHCLECSRSCDLWYEEPARILVSEEPVPYNPHRHAVVVTKARHPGLLRKILARLGIR